jgi:peptide deformylase
MRIGPAELLQLGDPALRQVSAPVGRVDDPAFARQRELLQEVLDAFRARFGFGRAIAAPQIGIGRRLVAVRLGARRLTLVDPEIVARRNGTLTLWDDCMCFPDLLVRVRRHAAITVRHTAEDGRRVELGFDDPREAELIQHELDHLDGILAVDRALDRESLVTRAAFARHRERFAAMVDLPPGAEGEPGP